MLICALIVFFPVLVNTVVGLRSVPQNLRDLMRSLRATRWQTSALPGDPGRLPVFLGGLRIGATLSVIGAVVGEFVGADRGLGFLINVARGQYDTALVFVAVFLLIAMALSLYGLVAWFERRLAWRTEGKLLMAHQPSRTIWLASSRRCSSLAVRGRAGTHPRARTLRLPMGYIPNVQYAPFYMAVERGDFRDGGLAIDFDYSFETDGVQLVGRASCRSRLPPVSRCSWRVPRGCRSST